MDTCLCSELRDESFGFRNGEHRRDGHHHELCPRFVSEQFLGNTQTNTQ